MAVAEVLRLSCIARSGQAGIRQWLVCTVRSFEDSNKPMQTNGEVSDAYGLQHREHDGALDQVAGLILTVRLQGADVEVGEVPRAGFQRRCKP